MSREAVLILAHGSRNAGARAEYLRLTSELATRLSEVELGFAVLEFPGDGLASIEEAVTRLAAEGAERIVALPYFLFAAGHVREDLPGELAEAARRAGVAISYQPPLGVCPELLDVLVSRAAEAEATLPAGPRPRTALVLVGAGTSDAESNAELFRAGRLLWERGGHDLVEVAFVSLTGPDVPETIARCRSLGAGRVLVVPYFLNTGVLSRRIGAKLEACRAEAPELELVLAGEIGLHDRLLELVSARARLGLERWPGHGLALPPCAVQGGAWACWLS